MLSERDEKRLEGVHPDLVRVIRRAAAESPVRFMVIEGLRSRETQARYLAQGKSKTMNSRHLTGHAVDIAPLIDQDDDGVAESHEISWRWPHFHSLAPHIKAAAVREGVEIEWGGDWRSFPDGPHWQLPRRVYPDGGQRA